MLTITNKIQHPIKFVSQELNIRRSFHFIAILWINNFIFVPVRQMSAGQKVSDN